MSPHPAALRPAHLLILATFLWGAATVVNKALLGPISPLDLLALQLAPGFLLALLLALALRAAFPRGRDLALAAGLGLMNPGLSYTFSMLGLDRVSASLAALLWATEPLMILLLAALVLRERVTLPIAGIVLCGLAGVGLIVRPGEGAADLRGVALLLAAVALCAVYTVASRSLAIRCAPLALLAVQHGAGLVWALALSAAMRSAGPEPAVELRVLAVAVLTGFLYYGLSYWLYLVALARVPAAVAGAYFNLIPVFALILAALALGERLDAVAWCGAALIVGAAAVLVRLTAGHGGQSGAA
jgi:drug/metabolite transporter (DMT)-like permease